MPRVRYLPEGNEVEAAPGVTCGETDNPAQVGAWRYVARVSDVVTPYFGRPWTWLTSICQSWPGADADRRQRDDDVGEEDGGVDAPFRPETSQPTRLPSPSSCRPRANA